MQIEDGLGGPLEALVIGQHRNPIHRLGVSGDDALGFVGGTGWMPSGEDLDSVFEACAVALD
jgi:hypothetical protein